MVREVLGLLIFEALLAAAGFGVLHATGLVGRDRRSILVAAGPALLTGTALVVQIQILLVVVGLPLTAGLAALVSVLVWGLGLVVAGRQHRPLASESTRPPTGWIRTRLGRAGLILGGAYLAFGVYALARAPVRNDDARIWSLKGLALTYYDGLRPEIFVNPATYLAHPVYPLFQPVLEAVLGRAMGQPELRFLHAELWLLLIASGWTVGYLMWWRTGRRIREQIGLAFVALVAVTPSIVGNIWSGYADATGAVLLATGTVAVALWLEGREAGHLCLGTILLTAAANTKDEDLVGVALVLLILGAVLLVRREWPRLRLWLASLVAAVVLIAPWRIWTAAHHLHEGVVPPVPRALSPVFVLDRLPQLKQTASAMIGQTLTEWGWLAAAFIAICILSVITRTSRRLGWFYLATFAAVVASLLWLYTTTPENLSFLITTSMNRTVALFMVLSAFGSGHLLTRMVSSD